MEEVVDDFEWNILFRGWVYKMFKNSVSRNFFSNFSEEKEKPYFIATINSAKYVNSKSRK